MDRRTFGSALIALAAAPKLVWSAESYPSGPVLALVGLPPGGMADSVLRTLTNEMAAQFPGGIVVENKPGAGGAIAASLLARARPDGSTIGLVPNANLSITPWVSKVQYQPDDLHLLMNVVSFPPVIVVSEKSPYKTMADMVEAAKKAPGTISIGFPGRTTNSHLTAATIQRVTGAHLLEVPYKGWAQMLPALLGGHLDVAVAQPGEAVGHVRDGQLRALGVAGEARLPRFPGAPTLKEQGFDVSTSASFILAVPKDTPKNVRDYILESGRKAVLSKSFQEFADTTGIQVDFMDPDETAAHIKKQTDNYKSILAGLKLDD